MALAVSDDDYVCTLDEKSLKKAKDELNEDPANRLGAVQKFRELVLQQPHIKCPTGIYSCDLFGSGARVKGLVLQANEVPYHVITNEVLLDIYFVKIRYFREGSGLSDLGQVILTCVSL